MSFLQPWLLAALPLVAIPLIIHLVNQRRFQTIEWAAMMFLLAARRMARGYSRLRQWLIMLARMGAIAALVLAVSRPLASGVLGLAAGGRADTTIILLDRSPSMQERNTAGPSKLETGRGQLVRALQTLRSDRWVLIDSATCQPRELSSPATLESAPETGPASAPADLPAMLQEAYRYIQENHTGQTEIWICSDLRHDDWSPESNRWSSLRNAFLEMPQGVRFHLLAYPRTAKSNVAVRVTDVRRQETDDGAELLVSLELSRAEGIEEKVTLPVQIEIEGARSVVPVELSSPLTELKDHQIPLERARERGWGKISIPADANPADDDYYFVFDRPPPRRAVLVCEDPRAERPLALATAIAPEPGLDCSGQTIDAGQLATVDWDQTALLIWQASLPTGPAAASVQAFVDRGGQVIFFPPANPGDEQLFGVRWKSWVTDPDHVPIETWRSDEDALARTLNGAALPVGQLEVLRYCGLSGEVTALATLRGGSPLFARAPTKRGGVYFCATTPSPVDSSLATSGVVLYAFVQRLLATGADILAQVRQLDAGEPDGEDPASWTRVADTDQGLSTEMAYHRGVYRDGDRLLAVNRPTAEDEVKVLTDEQVAELFRGLNYARVDDEAGSVGSLVQEIWRAFLGTMLAALVLEAALCLPKTAKNQTRKRGGPKLGDAGCGATRGPHDDRRAFAHVPVVAVVDLRGPRRRGGDVGPELDRLAPQRLPHGCGTPRAIEACARHARGGPVQSAGMGRRVPPGRKAHDRRAVGRLDEHGHARRIGRDGGADVGLLAARSSATARGQHVLGFAARTDGRRGTGDFAAGNGPRHESVSAACRRDGKVPQPARCRAGFRR